MSSPWWMTAAGIALLGFQVGCREKMVAPTGPLILANVGSQNITVEDLQKEAARRHAANQVVPEKSALLKEMVDRLCLVERAKQAGIDTEYETKRTLEGVLITKLREKELEARLNSVDVSDEEVREAHEAYAAKAAKTPKVRLALLFLEMTSAMSAGKKEELRRRMEEAQHKAKDLPGGGGRGPSAGGFGSLAAEYSEDQLTRYRGGDIGWLDSGNLNYRWPKIVLETGYALEKGAMSGILETEGGLYLVMKTDTRESNAIPFEEARPGLRHEILGRKRRAVEEAFLAETARVVKSEIHAAALDSVNLPTQPAAGKPAEVQPPASPVSVSTVNPH